MVTKDRKAYDKAIKKSFEKYNRDTSKILENYKANPNQGSFTPALEKYHKQCDPYWEKLKKRNEAITKKYGIR